jgi:hypothetical protein
MELSSRDKEGISSLNPGCVQLDAKLIVAAVCYLASTSS